MLESSRNSWHFRVYDWWYHRKHYGNPAPLNVNLCPYMRAVMFWSWLRPLFKDGWTVCIKDFDVPIIPIITWATIILSWPLLFSFKVAIDIWLGYGIIIGLLIFAVVCIYLIETFSKSRGKKKLADFGHLTAEYLHYKHEKICPIVKFK